jgi:hypothetical protein
MDAVRVCDWLELRAWDGVPVSVPPGENIWDEDCDWDGDKLGVAVADPLPEDDGVVVCEADALEEAVTLAVKEELAAHVLLIARSRMPRK